MATEVIVKPNTTLLRLVATHADAFYKQEWYYDQEFANTPAVVGKLRYNKKESYTAVQYAILYLDDDQVWDKLDTKYVWTSDRDDNGDQVYVGMGGLTGFQIHRYLPINPKLFLNERETFVDKS